MAGNEDSTSGATPATEKAARVMTEVGGVRSSEDLAPDLWFGQPARERRDATCSAEVKSNKGRSDGPRGLTAPDKVRELQITLYRSGVKYRHREMELGKPDAGKPPVRFDEGGRR